MHKVKHSLEIIVPITPFLSLNRDFACRIKKNVLPLSRFCSAVPFGDDRMKRESGENPEQSRCCVLRKKLFNPHLPLPYDEGGKANSRSESEDLQSHESVFCALCSRGKRLGELRFIHYRNMNKTKRTATAVFLTLCLGCPVHAGVPDSTLTSTHTINEVEVQAQRLATQVTTTTATQEIKQEEMRRLAIQNAAEAIRHFAGVMVRDYGGIGGLKTVSVRGLGATHTAVSYDDVVIGNCLAGQTDLGRYASSTLSGISLHVGQGSNLLSTARALASGSLVNMSSQQWLPKDKPYSLNANLQGGSFGYFSPTLNTTHKIGEHTQAGMSYSLITAHGQYPFTLPNVNTVVSEKRTNTDVYQLSEEWNLQHRIDSSSTIDAKVYYYDSERGLPGAVILYNNHSTERLTEKNLFAQARYAKQWDTKWHLRAIAKYTYGYSHYTETNVKYPGGKYAEKFDQDEYYLQATLLYRPSWHWQLSIAQDGFINTLDSDIPNFIYPIRYTSLTALQAQYHNHWLNVRGILLGTLINETSTKIQNSESRTHKELNPTLSASLRPLSDIPLYLRLMYKSTFRMPTFNELYYQATGNRELRPENAQEYTLGIAWQAPQTGCLETFSITADGYFNDVTDKIVAFPTTYVWKMANYGRVHITGLDAALNTQLRFAPKTALSIGASYTLQHAINVTDPEAQGYGLQLPYTPLHSGSMRLLLTTPWVGIGYSMIASSERYSMSQQIARYRIAPYAEHTLTLTRDFTLRGIGLIVQAEAINLTNAHYEIIQYYPMPGRQFRLSFTVKI